MDCITHKKPYEYICRAPGCDAPLLCSQCRKLHLMSSKQKREDHLINILPIKSGYEEAGLNLSKNLDKLKQLIKPFQNELQISEKVTKQKKKLIEERDRIIKQVTQIFDYQIKQLHEMNIKQTKVLDPKLFTVEEIKAKIAKIQQLQRTYKLDQNKLRQSLSYSEQNFINHLKRNNSRLSSMELQVNQYYIYDDTKHDFYISRLELKKKTLNNKLLQKISNQSDLYFLINDDYRYSKYLHYYSPSQNVLRIYDLETNLWKQVRYQSTNKYADEFDARLASFGATLYQSTTQTFYLIGGQVNQSKSKQIISYSIIDKKWSRYQMKNARSSAMATLLYDSMGNHYILIAGGVSAEKKHMKSCQIFLPKLQKSFQVGPMNFAVASGTLVTFNNTIVFRIGGLGQFKPNIASICEIAEKCDLTKCLQIISQNQFQIMQQNQLDKLLKRQQYLKWTYMDIQSVNNDPIKKFNLFYANQAAIQINPNQILVFGGVTHNNAGVKQTYILAVQTIKTKSNNPSYRYYARWINQKPLVSAEGFIGLRPIIYNKKVMSLQNISQGDQYLQKQKRLIEFNMFDWRQIQNIVI